MTSFVEKVAAGEKASIENTQSTALSISLISDSGCNFDIELMPGQVIAFGAGNSDAQVILHQGNPAALLIIKPELAS